VSDAEGHIVKARESLEFAKYALAGEYTDEAGRGAYMAAYHAALAFISARTGKSPKTHSVGRTRDRGRFTVDGGNRDPDRISLMM
jgi:uncharacterized protein (UPF0332 family)